MRHSLILLLFITSFLSHAQNPEFSRGFIFYGGLSQGINSRFDHSPDYWMGSLSLFPAYAIAPGHVRAGVQTELTYTMKNASFLAGPRIDIRMANLKLGNLGTAGNFHMGVEHLFGTGQQRLFGIITAFELFKMLSLDVRVHRDYRQERWWLRTGIGYNFLRKKRTSPTGSDPLDPD
jgi:hypothetical protein